MEQNDLLPIYTSSAVEETQDALTTSSANTASDASSEVQLLLSMVNSLVDNRLSSILSSTNPLTDMQNLLQNNNTQQHPLPVAAFPSTPSLYTATALHSANQTAPGVNNGSFTLQQTYLQQQQQQHFHIATAPKQSFG